MDKLMYTIRTKEQLDSALGKGLVQLYDVFKEPPYEEKFEPTEVIDIFNGYQERGVLVVSENPINSQLLGFAAALPLAEEPIVAELAKPFGFSETDTWYFADLGVRADARRKGIATQMVTELALQVPVDRLLMRTSENNIASKTANMRIGFQEIPGMEQVVSQMRQDGQIGTDRRIFLARDRACISTQTS